MSALQPAGTGISPWAGRQVVLPSHGAGDAAEALDRRLSEMAQPPPTSAPSDPTAIMANGPLAERIFSVSATLKVLVSQVSMHLPDAWRRQLFRSLDRLLDPDDWDESDRLVSPDSFFTFLRLVLLRGPLRGIAFGVSPEGHLLAGRARDGDSLTLEFIGNDEVRWSVVRHTGERRESAAGRTTIDRVPDVLAPYAPQLWSGHGDDKPA